ncbi:MAG: DUF975 family protein [Oscillospiraceae bacterium]|nr:DUF975 family protein [Oscillospiraceae bacterium]
MSRFNAVLRKDARRCLKGRWGKAAAGTLFLSGICAIVMLLEEFGMNALSLFGKELQVPFLAVPVTSAQSVLSILFGVLSVPVLAPLCVGMQKWYFRLADGPTPDLRMIFDYYADGRLYGKALWLTLNVFLRTAVFGALMALLPAGIRTAQLWVSGFDSAAAAVGEALLFLLFVVMTVLSAVLTLCFGLRYFLTVYYLAGDENISVRQAVRCSVRAMKGMKGQVFSLMLGWLPLLLCCLLLVPALFVLPYCNTALAINARWLMGRDDRLHPAEPSVGEAPSVSADTIVF